MAAAGVATVALSVRLIANAAQLVIDLAKGGGSDAVAAAMTRQNAITKEYAFRCGKQDLLCWVMPTVRT